MGLTLIATPIGNPNDISLRALDSLKSCDAIIGEEPKVTRKILKELGVPLKEVYSLNEHSRGEDIEDLLTLCESKNIALISDCGTPSFCDPGSELVRQCRKKGIPIHSLPGASSLMQIISMSSRPLKKFRFEGFLPAKTELRIQALKSIRSAKEALILMDTPYRLHKLVDELTQTFPKRTALIGLDLTSDEELYIEGSFKHIKSSLKKKKAEFIILIYPEQ